MRSWKACVGTREESPFYAEVKRTQASIPRPFKTKSTKPNWKCTIAEREVRIRFVWILIGLDLTWFTRYWFPEELISPLAKPFLTLPLDSYFVRT
ncbi:hypothetical protein H5410_055775 [Solanum commersonii]|uniref:Uncharacterized protein n=1 Tax=Solanum commersonii TaxID=4109 RepID=A0A9J5WIH1_SOLCO|nr:hypothetical protein H5410_055775 [Solanum commersonii]